MWKGPLAVVIPWWHHQMEIFSALLALYAGNSPVTGEFPTRRPVTRIFDVFFDLCLDKRLGKQSRRRWFKMPSRSLWRHWNAYGDKMRYSYGSVALSHRYIISILHEVSCSSFPACISLQWRHNESDGVSNHLRLHWLLNCWFRRKSKKTSKLRVTGLCVGNSPVTSELPAQKASDAENISIWWRHHNILEIAVAWIPLLKRYEIFIIVSKVNAIINEFCGNRDDTLHLVHA